MERMKKLNGETERLSLDLLDAKSYSPKRVEAFQSSSHRPMATDAGFGNLVRSLDSKSLYGHYSLRLPSAFRPLFTFDIGTRADRMTASYHQAIVVDTISSIILSLSTFLQVRWISSFRC